MNKMKSILVIVMLALSMAAKAQVTRVSLQASGLTCSMCSNAIHKALKTLDFIEKVDANVKTYTFELAFKVNSNVDFDRIKKKVEDAGFAVSSFMAAVYFNKVQIKKDQPVVIGDKTFLFTSNGDQVLDGVRELKVIDKGFVSSGEYRKNSFPVLTPGTYHAVLN